MTHDTVVSCHRTNIEAVTRMVFEAMLGLRVQADCAASELPVAGELTAAVYYAGKWSGALVLDCSQAQAEAWSQRVLGPVDAASLDDVARDGLGEIANMLAGNLKPLLRPGVGLTMPVIVQGDCHTLRLCGHTTSEHLAFTDALGTFRVTLFEEAETA